MSQLRPAWLTDDAQWAEQLAVIPDDDASWLTKQWEMAGGSPPDLDRSWIQMETVDEAPPWWSVVALVLGILGLGFGLTWLGTVLFPFPAGP